MKKISLFFALCIFSVKLFSQRLPEFSDSMIIMPNLELLKDKIADIKNNPRSSAYKFAGNLTDDDLNDMAVINYVAIYPDTLTNNIEYKVDDNLFFLYFKKKNRLLLWEEDKRLQQGLLRDVKNYHFRAKELQYEIEYLNKYSTTKKLFLIYFFPLDRGRNEVLAYRDKYSYYEYKPLLQNKHFESFSSLFEYFFYLPQYYSDIYKKRG
jgi:hypothetical protein